MSRVSFRPTSRCRERGWLEKYNTVVCAPTGPRQQGGDQQHAQYRTNHNDTSGCSCCRPENVSILRSLMWVSRNPFFTQHTKGGLRYRALGPFYDLSSSMGPFNSPSAMKYAGWGKTSGLILKVFFSWQYPYIMSIYKIITNRKMLWSFIKFTPLILGA